MNTNMYKTQQLAQRAISEDADSPFTTTFSPNREVLEVTSHRLAERELEKDAPKTGYPELDRIITGFIPAHLYTLSGDTNVGKTSIAVNFAYRVMKQGKKVLYFALEPDTKVVDYFLSVGLNKCFQDLSKQDFETMHELPEMKNLTIILGRDMGSDIDFEKIINEQEDDYDLIIIDHIGYFVSSLKNPLQEQGNVMKKLANLTRSKKTAIMVIAHMRKPNPNEKKHTLKTIDDISGSAAFKQDSTEVLIVNRFPDSQDKNKISNIGTIFVAKTKQGSNGVFPILFAQRTAFITTKEEFEILHSRFINSLEV